MLSEYELCWLSLVNFWEMEVGGGGGGEEMST